MWGKALALAASSGRLPEAMAGNLVLRKPLFLPSTVTPSTAPVDGGGWDLAACNAESGAERLVGTVRPL
jgi:hypothetical protein